MKKIKTIIASVVFMLGIVAVPTLVPATVSASAEEEICKGATGNANCKATGEKTDLPALIRTIINVLLFVVGLVSVIMIVVGGLRYVLSGGDSNAVNGAKNTVLYAVVGIVVAFMAYAIVNFVIKNLG